MSYSIKEKEPTPVCIKEKEPTLVCSDQDMLYSIKEKASEIRICHTHTALEERANTGLLRSRYVI